MSCNRLTYRLCRPLGQLDHARPVGLLVGVDLGAELRGQLPCAALGLVLVLVANDRQLLALLADLLLLVETIRK